MCLWKLAVIGWLCCFIFYLLPPLFQMIMASSTWQLAQLPLYLFHTLCLFSSVILFSFLLHTLFYIFTLQFLRKTRSGTHSHRYKQTRNNLFSLLCVRICVTSPPPGCSETTHSLKENTKSMNNDKKKIDKTTKTEANNNNIWKVLGLDMSVSQKVLVLRNENVIYPSFS